MKRKNILKLIELIDNAKYLYISGNGGAGKSSFSKEIKKYLEDVGKKVNLISTDDFIIDTNVRNNSVCKWSLDGTYHSGHYTSCCENSYFWRALDTILFSLQEGRDIYYKPKGSGDGIILLYANADLTIIEGIGTAFMQRLPNSRSFWFECETETEIQRRMKRGNLSREEVEARFFVRESQFKTFVLPERKDFDYIIKTDNENLLINKNKG